MKLKRKHPLYSTSRIGSLNNTIIIQMATIPSAIINAIDALVRVKPS